MLAVTVADPMGPWYDDIKSPDEVVATTAAPVESTTADPSDAGNLFIYPNNNIHSVTSRPSSMTVGDSR